MAAQDGQYSALEPDGFVAKGLERYLSRLEARPSKKQKRPPLPAAKRLKACYGKPVPELEQLDKVLAKAGFLDTRGLVEWAPEVRGPVIEPAKGKNLAEELLVQGQEKWPPLLEELFAGAVALGWTQSGDLWLYGLYDSAAGAPERHAVHLWSHASARVKSTVAGDLDAFALALVLLDQVEEGAITSKVAARVAEQLSGRVCVTWPFERLIEKLVHGKPRPCPTAGYLTAGRSDRSAWIKAALLGEPMSVVRREFEPELNPALDDKAWAKQLAQAAAVPPEALYLLFRAFLFAQPERLAAAVAAFARSPAPLVRDAAELMKQLQAGRKELGQVPDAQALQKDVATLRLDPELPKAPPKKKARR